MKQTAKILASSIMKENKCSDLSFGCLCHAKWKMEKR